MTKPMKYRDLTALLREAGFTARLGKGDHEVWTAPGIGRHVVLTLTREVSPGLVRKALKVIAETKEE